MIGQDSTNRHPDPQGGIDTKLSLAMAMAAIAMLSLATSATAGITTDFDSFNTGTVDGQGGWSAPSRWDQEVVDLGGGNKVWRVSNAVNGSSFSDMPMAPRPGGIPTNTTTDPVNSQPDFFAGESSTGATHNYFFAQFDFRSATDSFQQGARITISPDSGNGGRQGFVALEDTVDGLAITTQNATSSGDFEPSITIASGLSRTDFHTLGIELLFNDGLYNDVANYYVNGVLVHSDRSWEEYYRNHQSTIHPLGVPVQTLLFRLSSDASSSVLGGGFYIDNVSINLDVQAVPEPSTLAAASLAALLGLGVAWRRRRAASA